MFKNPTIFRTIITSRKSFSSNIFRNLTKKESKVVDLYDFRNEKQLNNKILITCEHATNE